MYKDVINIIGMEDVDYKAIAIEVAKASPSAFVKAFRKTVEGGANISENTFSFLATLDIPASKFDAIVRQIGHESWAQEILTLLYSKDNADRPKKISAIKLYRAESGQGFKESKYFIDNLMDL